MLKNNFYFLASKGGGGGGQNSLLKHIALSCSVDIYGIANFIQSFPDTFQLAQSASE